MSQHPSLKTSSAEKKHRTVLKRYERFFAFKDKGVLKEGDSVFGMPKLKIARVKIKKEKAEEKPEEAKAVAAEAATQAAAQGAAQKESAAKPAKEGKKEKK